MMLCCKYFILVPGYLFSSSVVIPHCNTVFTAVTMFYCAKQFAFFTVGNMGPLDSLK